MVSKGFIAALAIVAVVAVTGYALWADDAKVMTYDEYITHEHKRLKESDSDDLDDVEKALAANLTDNKSSLETAVMLAVDTSTKQQFKDNLKHVGEYDWAKKPVGENGWKYLAEAAVLSDKATSGMVDYTSILDGRPADAIKDKDGFMSSWVRVDELLSQTADAEHLTIPFDGDDLQGFCFYRIKKYALFCDIIELEDAPKIKFHRIKRVLGLESNAAIPPMLIVEMLESIWSHIFATAIRRSFQRGLLSSEESKALGLQMPELKPLSQLIEAEIYYVGNSKPSDGGDFAGTSMKWRYEQEEKQPGDIGGWVSEWITENKGQADYYIDAIKWLKSHPGSLDSPKYIANLLKQDLAAFSSKQSSSFLLNWSEMAERIIHAKSIAEPVTETHKPDWLTNTPMFKCIIEGNEVVVKWDSEHPVVKHNKQGGEVSRFRWK